MSTIKALGIPKIKSLGLNNSNENNIVNNDTNISVVGFWSTDASGKNKISKARLGDTVYYNIRTFGIPKNSMLTLQLFDEDDPLSDDSKFAGKKIHYDVYTDNNGKAVQKVKLEESWEENITDDKDYFPTIELYFDITYRNKKNEKVTFELDNAILNVGYSLRNLYIRKPISQYSLPELLTSNGDTLVFAIGETLEIEDKIKDNIIEGLDGARYFLAARTLKSGALVTNTDVIKFKKRVYTYDIYKNDGTFVKVTKGSNFGWKQNGKVTTKGISQIDYFSNKGIGNNILKIAKNVVELWDIKDIAELLTGEADSIPIPHPLGFVMQLIAEQAISEYNEMWDEVVSLIFEKAKVGGLKEIEKFVTYRGGDKFFIKKISTETLKKLLKNNISRIEKVKDEIDMGNNLLHHAVFSWQKKETINNDVAILECIFVGDKLLNL